MKISIALMLALAGLSAAHATELETSGTMMVRLPTQEERILVLADEVISTEGECKAICMLPTALD